MQNPAQYAGILCGDQAFQRFAASRANLPGHQFNTSAAAEFLRQNCGITSRRELNTNPAARARLDVLRTEFDAWRGKIAPQR